MSTWREGEKGMGRVGKGRTRKQESSKKGTRDQRGHAAPFIVGQAYLAVVR